MPGELNELGLKWIELNESNICCVYGAPVYLPSNDPLQRILWIKSNWKLYQKKKTTPHHHHITSTCVFVDDVGIPLTGIHYGFSMCMFFFVSVEIFPIWSSRIWIVIVMIIMVTHTHKHRETHRERKCKTKDDIFKYEEKNLKWIMPCILITTNKLHVCICISQCFFWVWSSGLLKSFMFIVEVENSLLFRVNVHRPNSNECQRNKFFFFC